MKNTKLLRILPVLLLSGFISACSQSIASRDAFPGTAIQSSASGQDVRPINLMDF